MELAAIILAVTVVVLLYMGNRYLKDLRAIRRELADGKSLNEINTMVRETREQLLTDYDEVTTGLDKRIERLEALTREAETTLSRLENVMNSDRLKILEERGILFAIEPSQGENSPEADRNKRIADLLAGGATVEEVSRITEASVREVELVRLLLKRRREVEGA